MDELIALSEKSINLKRNEYLKVKGSTDTQIYFVESGSLRVFVLDNADEQIIRFGYTGDILVSLDSFLTEKPSDFIIQAIKKTRLSVVSKKRFMQFIQANDENRERWIQILEDLVLQQMEREKDILTTSPKERYNRVLTRSPRLFQEIPNKYIANYLRMSPETLSRLKKS
jgi:CRP-like cAMP-binding protein